MYRLVVYELVFFCRCGSTRLYWRTSVHTVFVFSIVVSASVGAAFGAFPNYVALLHSSWSNLLLWAVIGLLLGLYIDDRTCVKSSGISYGFFLTLTFLISGFHSSTDKIWAFALLCVVLSPIGALCGACLVFMGNWIKRKFV